MDETHNWNFIKTCVVIELLKSFQVVEKYITTRYRICISLYLIDPSPPLCVPALAVQLQLDGMQLRSRLNCWFSPLFPSFRVARRPQLRFEGAYPNRLTSLPRISGHGKVILLVWLSTTKLTESTENFSEFSWYLPRKNRACRLWLKQPETILHFPIGAHTIVHRVI